MTPDHDEPSDAQTTTADDQMAAPEGPADDGRVDNGPAPVPVAPLPEFDVPPGATEVATCRHCGRPFRSEQALALHLGGAHAAALDPAETAAYEDAVERERDDLFVYHAKVVTALGAIYSVTVILYMVAFGSGII